MQSHPSPYDVNPSKPKPSAAEAAAINAHAIAAIHARMRKEEPSIAELSNPTGRQPKNGGMSTKEIVAERLRQRKVRVGWKGGNLDLDREY
jgi:hypothetical protein